MFLNLPSSDQIGFNYWMPSKLGVTAFAIVVGGSSVWWERQSMEGVLIAGEVPSEHCRGTFKQDTKPTNAHIEPSDGPSLHPYVHPSHDHKKG